MTEEHRKFTFKIEQKPEGGYFLHSDNPPLHIEGATREEVEEKLKGEFMKLMPEGMAKTLLALSHMPGVTMHTNIKIKEGSPVEKTFSTSGAQPMLVNTADSTTPLASGPKAEPLISPKLIIILLLLLGVALMVWRVMPH